MPEQAKIAHKFMTLELEGGVACGICAAKRGSFSGAKKKGEEISVFIEHYLFGKEKANVTHFARVKYVIKMTLISPLGCS